MAKQSKAERLAAGALRKVEQAHADFLEASRLQDEESENLYQTGLRLLNTSAIRDAESRENAERATALGVQF